MVHSVQSVMAPTKASSVPSFARRGLPLRHKVPLFLFLGLFAVLATWTWLAYRSVRDASLALAHERMNALVGEIVSSTATSLRTRSTALARAVSVAPVADYLASGGASASGEAVRLLGQLAQATSVHRAAYFAADGTPLRASQRTDSVGAAASDVLLVERHEELASDFRSALSAPERVAVGRMRLMDDQIVIPHVAAVLHGRDPAGFAVVWRRVAANRQELEQISLLIGSDARLFVGNDRSDLWSDFVRRADAPTADLPATGELRRYARPEGGRVVAASRPIEGTPLVLRLEFAEADVLAPATRSLRQSILFGVVLLVVATTASWLISRRITSPLHELSTAARALAAGDYGRTARVSRGDEIGEVAASFNLMVARVAEAHASLESKVRDRTAQLEERNQELEAFARSISHDLRAPLRAMHGFSQALLEDCGPQLDETGRSYATRIASAAARMDAMIRDLLEYSRVSRAELSLAPLDTGEVVQAAVSQLEADIASRGAHVSVTQPMPAVVAHRRVLEQVIANLVSNGLKFVAAGTSPAIAIRAEPMGRFVRLWVEDNGIGVDPAHQARIFNVFEKLHPATQFAGTGIGLAIVRKGVERMGGAVGVESDAGHGSRFWVDLQLAGA
jgi:signal transduction histidine kinase